MEMILQVAIVLGLCHPAQLFFIQTSGRLESDHTLFYVEENATLHCRKNSPFASALVFKIGGLPVNEEYVTRVSDRYARLDKPVTVDDAAEALYACRDPSEIGSQTIYTDYAPQNATYFEMVWLHKASLIVRWKHGPGNITYKNIHTDKVIRITSEWRRVQSDSSGNWKKCNISTSTSCTISDIYNRDDIFAMRVNVTNVKRSDTKTTIFIGQKVFNYGKPSPPTLDGIENLGKRSVKLSVRSSWSKVIRRITYCRTGVENNPCSEVDIPVENQTEPSLDDITLRTMVITLHPSYTYTLKVQDKFVDGGYFSDYSNLLSVTMPEDVPAAGPEVTPGGFYWDSPDCSKTPSSATIYIYFQEVPEDQQNGQPTSYSGEITSSAGKGKEFHTSASDARTLKVEGLDCRKGFGASLYLSNKEGRSPAAALNVPPWDQELYNKIKNLDLKLRAVDGNITAELNLNPDLEEHTFLLYYCTRNDADPNQCQAQVSSVRLSSTESGVAVPAEALNMVGLAAVSPQGRTIGIVKSNCIYNPQNVRKAISTVQAIPQEGGIVVSWQSERCDPDKRILIRQYEIELCLQTRGADCQSHKIRGEENSWTTSALEAGSNYSIRIRSETDGGWSPFSEPRMVRVPEGGKGLDTGVTIGIVMGTLLVCIILGVLIFCYCRDKMTRLRRLFSKDIKTSHFKNDTCGQNNHIIGVDNVGANINNNDDDNNNKGGSTKSIPHLITQQISDDSGCDPTTPPQSPFSDGPVVTAPGDPAQRCSDPANLSTPAEDSLGSLTSPKVVCDISLSQDKGEGADTRSRREDGTVPPYVSAAVVSSASSFSGADSDRVPLTRAANNEWMVYHAARDPPKVGQGNVSPFPYPMSSLPSGVPGSGKKMAEGDVISPKQDRKDGVVLDPSALEVTSASKGISSYVRLSTPGSVSFSAPNEETVRKSTLGEESDEDEALLDDGLQDCVSESSPGSLQIDTEQSMPAGYSSEERSEEVPHPLKEAETKLNSAYVTHPGQMQSSQTNSDAAGEDRPTLTEQTTGSQQPDQGQSGLHLAYVSLKPQMEQVQPALYPEEEEEDNLSECSESDGEKADAAGDHDRAQHAGQQAAGEGPAASRHDYVPLPPLPGASLPPAGLHPSSMAFTAEKEESDADSSDSIPSNGNREGHATSMGGVLDGNGYVHIKLNGRTAPDTTGAAADGLGENGDVRIENSSDGNACGKGQPTSDTKSQTCPKYILDRSGYVPIGNVPDRNNLLTHGKERRDWENRGQTSPGDTLDGNGYVRLENSTVGSTHEKGLTDNTAQTSPEGILDKNGYVHFENAPDRSNVLAHGNGLTGSDSRNHTHTDGYDQTDQKMQGEGTANQVNSNGYVPWQNLPFHNNREAQC